MHSIKVKLFGEDRLTKHVRYKGWLWDAIRKSYRQLQLRQKELEGVLREPMNSSAPLIADELFMSIASHWSLIAFAKYDFEGMFHKYELTVPSDLEMALYQEYLLFGYRIKESCKASLVKAGLRRPETTINGC